MKIRLLLLYCICIIFLTSEIFSQGADPPKVCELRDALNGCLRKTGESDRFMNYINQIRKDNEQQNQSLNQLRKDYELQTQSLNQLRKDNEQQTQNFNQIRKDYELQTKSLNQLRKDYQQLNSNCNITAKIRDKYVVDCNSQRTSLIDYINEKNFDSLFSDDNIKCRIHRKQLDNYFVYYNADNKLNNIFDISINNYKKIFENVDNFTNNKQKHYLIRKDDILYKDYSPLFINVYLPFTESSKNLFGYEKDNMNLGKFGWGINMNIYLFSTFYLDLDYSSLNPRNWFGINADATYPSYSVGGFGINWLPENWLGFGIGYFWGGIDVNEKLFFRGWKTKIDGYFMDKLFFNLSWFIPQNKGASVDFTPRFRVGIGYKIDAFWLKNIFFR